ncbi:MAG: SusD/RagB family nutrient-binding outer membrane lipoprotein [Chitinophagaceae bacterium]
MKKALIYIGLFAVMFTGCTKDFDAINTNPVATSAGTFNPNYLLSNLQFDFMNSITGYNGPFLFQAGWVQVFASTSSGSANYHSNDDKYVASGNTLDYQGRTWNNGYRSASEAYEMQNLTKDNPLYSNLNNIAVIMRVLAIQKITDIYGDAPYLEALQGKTGVTLPVYDNQQSIYTNMLKDLETATAALDPSKDKPSSDQFYKGDIAKWKKFGYSLMLQVAMRLTKADAATAKTYAEKAAAGGTFAGVADDAIIKGDDANGFTNGNGSALGVTDDLYQVRWSKTIIDWLVAKADPRLGVVAEVPADGLAANNSLAAGNNTAGIQKGLPNGYDLNGGATDISASPSYTGGTGTGGDFTKLGKYSRPRSFYRNRSGPFLVLTYAETELLLAEAAVRGFAVSGNASTHYKNGVSAALQSLSAYGTDATISATIADAYAIANPLDISSTNASLKDINEQIWVATGTFLNYVEAWSNWRRSGYPVLTPVVYTGNFSGGTIPRRQPYPPSEISLNPANYKAAVTGLSTGDSWTSKVWWDK